LQVFEVRPGAPPLPSHAVKEPTLLGGAFDADGAIDPAGVDRVVGAVRRAMSAARRLGVQQLYVFATSAVRDAANRDLVLDRVEAEAGVRPQYLTGVDEARLTYLAVHQWYGWSVGRQLVLDIGTLPPACRSGPGATSATRSERMPRSAAPCARQREGRP
jgi:exopolyphosphatase/guanosine-5'-triphosphate,3'-diphosphate pyrophosphatase